MVVQLNEWARGRGKDMSPNRGQGSFMKHILGVLSLEGQAYAPVSLEAEIRHRSIYIHRRSIRRQSDSNSHVCQHLRSGTSNPSARRALLSPRLDSTILDSSTSSDYAAEQHRAIVSHQVLNQFLGYPQPAAPRYRRGIQPNTTQFDFPTFFLPGEDGHDGLHGDDKSMI